MKGQQQFGRTTYNRKVCSRYSMIFFISDPQKIGYWTSGNDLAVEGQFVWGYPEESSMTYTDWFPGEPNNAFYDKRSVKNISVKYFYIQFLCPPSVRPKSVAVGASVSYGHISSLHLSRIPAVNLKCRSLHSFCNKQQSVAQYNKKLLKKEMSNS